MKKHKYISNINLGELKTTCIVMKKEVYSRTASGKNWKTKPDEIETVKVTADFYYNCCDSIPFFKNLAKCGGSERATFGYTYAGYLVTEIVSISPDYTVKMKRYFYILPDEETARNIYKLNF